MRLSKVSTCLLLMIVSGLCDATNSAGNDRAAFASDDPPIARRNAEDASTQVSVLVQVEGRPGLLTVDQFRLLEDVFVETYNEMAKSACSTPVTIQHAVIEKEISDFDAPGFGTTTQTFVLQYKASTSQEGLFFRDESDDVVRRALSAGRPKPWRSSRSSFTVITTGKKHATGTDRSGLDCGDLTEDAFLEAYRDALETSGVDLDSSIDQVLDISEMETVDCDPEVTTFMPDVTVSFVGDPSLATAEQLDALAHAFHQTYNSLNQLNPDTCDDLFREIVSVSLITEDESFDKDSSTTDRRAQGGENRELLTAEQYSFLFRMIARCHGCVSNTRLFNDVQGRRELLSPTPLPFKGRNLRHEDACMCPVTASEVRAPSVVEFKTGFQAAIEILQKESAIAEQLVQSVEDVSQVDEVACGVEKIFTAHVHVDLLGAPEFVTNYEIEKLGTAFASTYRKLASNFCDPFFRRIVHVGIDKTPEQVGVPDSDTEAQSFRFLFVIETGCRMCDGDMRLFSHSYNRKLETTETGAHAGRFEEGNLCFCSSDAIDNRPPYEEEFETAYNETIKNLKLENILHVVDVFEAGGFHTGFGHYHTSEPYSTEAPTAPEEPREATSGSMEFTITDPTPTCSPGEPKLPQTTASPPVCVAIDPATRETVEVKLFDTCPQLDNHVGRRSFEVCCIDKEGKPGCMKCEECAPYREAPQQCCNTDSIKSEGWCARLGYDTCCKAGNLGSDEPFGHNFFCLATINGKKPECPGPSN